MLHQQFLDPLVQENTHSGRITGCSPTRARTGCFKIDSPKKCNSSQVPVSHCVKKQIVLSSLHREIFANKLFIHLASMFHLTTLLFMGIQIWHKSKFTWWLVCHFLSLPFEVMLLELLTGSDWLWHCCYVTRRISVCTSPSGLKSAKFSIHLLEVRPEPLFLLTVKLSAYPSFLNPPPSSMSPSLHSHDLSSSCHWFALFPPKKTTECESWR